MKSSNKLILTGELAGKQVRLCLHSASSKKGLRNFARWGEKNSEW